MLETTNVKESVAGKVKLELLRQKQEKLRAQIAQVEASEKVKARKEDTRLKVLVGAAMLADASMHSENVALIAAVTRSPGRMRM